MKRSKIRAFNERGQAEFEQFIALGKISEEPPPLYLLEKAYSDELEYSEVIAARPFQTKYDMGMAVATAVDKINIAKLFANDTAWSWLSLFFYQSTMPKKGKGWFVGAPSRHLIERIPGRHQDQSHRHLVKASAVCVDRFGPQARVLMDKPDGQSKIEEQVMSRNTELQLSTSVPFIKALNRLYWDTEHHEIRRGARGEGPGSIMRLIRVLNQLDTTYDFSSLQADEIVSLLPAKEFGAVFQRTAKTSKGRASKV
jgi:hypothetical protein